MHENRRNRCCILGSWLWKSWANVIFKCWLNWLDQNEINISFDFLIRPLRPIYVSLKCSAVRVAIETHSGLIIINMKVPHVLTRVDSRFKETSFGRSLNHSSQKASRLQSQHEASLSQFQDLLHRLTFLSHEQHTKASFNECKAILHRKGLGIMT